MEPAPANQPSTPASIPPAVTRRLPWYRWLYVQVLMAVAIGIVVGALWPDFGKTLLPLGEGFINLVKMIIAPIIFCTVVHGIASLGGGRQLGRLGIKTLVYFEVVSTFALIIGLVVVNVLKPGAGGHFQPGDVSKVQGLVDKAHAQNVADFILGIIPKAFFEPFTTGNILQVLLVSLLSGFAISFLGEKGRPILWALSQVEQVFFGIMRMIVRIAPIAAFGAMAYTVGSQGLASLWPLLSLMAGFYATAIVFIVVVLGLIARAAGFSIFRFIAYIKEELLLVLGTSSSETALPGMIAKMRRLGCSQSTVGFVIPTGYSFNLDGTNIYMTMAAIFLAQATNTPLSLGQQITLLLVAMLSSKGAAAVTGGGLIALAATLMAVRTTSPDGAATVPLIPLSSLAMLIGIDRFMSECRSLTNLIGNGVATVVISRSEGELSAEHLRQALKNGAQPNP